MDPREVPALFGPFQGGRQRSDDGSGLGLAVVRAITGTVTATPYRGGGLTVRASNCPVAAAPLPHRTAAPRPGDRHRQR
ncbi:ATP-binding protein [Kitasatospora sp. NPDC058406]|uniref:ATP-binding protein n=1 Tax=Kitasatospora sp. NPDC058406 TaxID=3346483 RepID=UPI00365B8641